LEIVPEAEEVAFFENCGESWRAKGPPFLFSHWVGALTLYKVAAPALETGRIAGTMVSQTTQRYLIANNRTFGRLLATALNRLTHQ
jgi:hypothetical protein